MAKKRRKHLFTVTEAAGELGVTPIRVRQLCQEGKAGERVGSVWILTRDEIEALKKRKTTPGPERGS